MGFSGVNIDTTNEVERLAGFTQSQIDSLYAIFKEKESQERLSDKDRNFTSHEWILDSGASFHMTSNITVVNELYDLAQVIYILIPNGIVVKVQWAGTVNLGHGLVL